MNLEMTNIVKKMLLVAEEYFEITWTHTKGHTGIVGNERADRMQTGERRG